MMNDEWFPAISVLRNYDTMDVRILRISPIGTDFLTKNS
ncbi:MAG: hypothetical protein RLZZ628_584 [Bacteroidota bacterium]|jgi:hypothetical protein